MNTSTLFQKVWNFCPLSLRGTFADQLVSQYPTDEPASVLLERIRAERAAQAAVKKPQGRKRKGFA